MNKWFVISLGTVLGISHIGMIGILATRNRFPDLNLPVGEYTSYEVEAGKEGYRVKYRSNDPKVMISNKEVNKPAGFLGVGKSKSFYTRQYTMDGEGQESSKKISNKTLECIKAEGGGESTGKVIGGSIGAAFAPTLSGIPFVGWVLAGAATMMGMETGGEIGGQMALDFADCDPEE